MATDGYETPEEELLEFQSVLSELDIAVNTKSSKFRSYKNAMLGCSRPIDFDSYCESFRLDDNTEIKNFVLNIKEYALNEQLDKKHISYFLQNIIDKKELYLLDRISLVQYNEFTNTNVKNLIEIINGHHRIEALRQFFQNSHLGMGDDYQDYKITMRIDIYHLDNPTSDKTMELFRAFNAVRPQKTDWSVKLLTQRLIHRLNEVFNTRTFTLIKDNNSHTQKPSIHMRDFIALLETRFKEQLKTMNSITQENINVMNLEPIIERFKNYNDSLLKKQLEWFNDIRQRPIIDNINIINEKMFDKARTAKCYLGFIKLIHLTNNCVCL